jgi:hypothetical protein
MSSLPGEDFLRLNISTESVSGFDRVTMFRPSRYVSTESPRVSTEFINYLLCFDRVY